MTLENSKNMDIKSAHKFCLWNRESISKSKNCGCFYCLRIFPVNQITEWCDVAENGTEPTALCPYCGMDSLVCDFDVDFDSDYLEEMRIYYF